MKTKPTKPTLMIVDDEPSQRKLLGGFFATFGFTIIEAESAEAMLDLLAQHAPDMILLDVRLPKMSGIDALPKIRERLPTVPVVLITAYADVRQAVAAVKSGADDYLSKPIDLEELKVAVYDALAIPTSDDAENKIALPDLPAEFIFKSRAMRQLIETVAVVAPSEAPILIQGPSGAGKELIAQLIHQWSPRASHPIVTTNCAGLSATLIESELFGHVKGAFTGASEDRKGLFRTASGGSLFLDEIGEMPLEMQPKLLRALETNQVTPVGSDRHVNVDTRLVAATNRNLMDEIKEGRFREDLFYRMSVVELIVPPLADRREDIIPLARHFASQFANRQVRMSPQASQAILTHSWTGNVRELRNAIQRACLLCQGDVILPEHLPAHIATDATVEVSDTGRLSQVERATILATLEECDENRTQAAKKLGISRRALIYKLHDIDADS
ncbi:sigma-54-dependent transcriptional regulator [Aporhodopirellula aestuarii]|uniref:Sigma-54 dependent transcriptional regulator n=1 Tax=Aporhodopirellula aestuarii TaxID=2950107 RepID=A0ABT0UAE4_9BACT|nr:sigma-54 dependent transcriptional regulator [Aporhodopirellula aestuarii]MCM2373977.1 sigma-54 dependent transcriptional regulator [Aporhodopirellula aestuarii]